MNVEIKEVSKIYGTQKAVDTVSFEAKKGEILGFLGPNGAGKTTTMKMLIGYLGIDYGEIKIGNELVNDSETTKKYIGYLPENNPLYLDMAVMDYLYFCAEIKSVPAEKIDQRIKEMVVLCGLDAEKHKKIGELSKGYRQRVGLAQAMIHDPEILILDEPTTGLDPNQIVQIRELIKNLGKEKTVIFSTHILSEVEAICDRVVIINKGKIVANGTPKSLKSQSSGRYSLTVKLKETVDEDIRQNLSSIEGVNLVEIVGEKNELLITADNENISEKVFNYAVENKLILIELTPKESKFEDIFRNLTLNQ